MSRFKAPSKGDRHASGNGTPVGVAQKRRNELPAPEVREGDRRCPVCRNAVRSLCGRCYVLGGGR